MSRNLFQGLLLATASREAYLLTGKGRPCEVPSTAAFTALRPWALPRLRSKQQKCLYSFNRLLVDQPSKNGHYRNSAHVLLQQASTGTALEFERVVIISSMWCMLASSKLSKAVSVEIVQIVVTQLAVAAHRSATRVPLPFGLYIHAVCAEALQPN